MQIKDHDLDVDILEELQYFDWTGESVKGIKFIACSPFRTERNPSFAVNLENGTFMDSGNDDEYFRKGNFIKLLALLRNEEYEDIEDYLIWKYTSYLADTELLELRMKLTVDEGKKELRYIDRSDITHLYQQRSDYLTGRGISLEVQTLFQTGYNPQNRTIAFLWTDKQGRIINIKYRRTDVKAFFYQKGGQQIKHHVFGIYQCIQHKAKRVFICESEIDAMTLWTYGYPAVAVGGSSLSENQKRILLSSGIEELVIATDNDKVGGRFREYLTEEFAGNLVILSFAFPDRVKDINDMTGEQIHKAVQTLATPTFSFLNLG
ncbi:hypothetical protein JCM17380_24360 [Desulfosporosinus burensis]